MALLKIALMGHPVLRQQARDLDPEELKRPEMQQFIDDLVDTMREFDGVGLAAPQAQNSINVLAFEVPGDSPDPKRASVPLTVLVNTKILWSSTETDEDWEGCLSIPDLRGLVRRPTSIDIDALDRYGAPIKKRLSGFTARVVQHEHDHTIGKVFLDRMESFETLTFLREYERYWRDRR